MLLLINMSCHIVAWLQLEDNSCHLGLEIIIPIPRMAWQIQIPVRVAKTKYYIWTISPTTIA